MILLLNNCPLADDSAVEEHQPVELGCLPPAGAGLELWAGAERLEPFLRPGDPAWRWRWVAPPSAGAHALHLVATWPDGRREEVPLRLVVRPRKIDEEQHRQILADLQRLGRALALALGGAAQPAGLAPAPAPTTPAEELHSLFGADFDRLAAAALRLSRRLPDRLTPYLSQTPIGEARDLSGLAEAPVGRGTGGQGNGGMGGTPPSPLVGEGGRGGEGGGGDIADLPLTAPERLMRPSYDSYEARLLRRLIETLLRRAERLLAGPGLPRPAQERLEQASVRLRELRGLPFLAEVPPLAQYRGPTPRLQRDPDYRIVLQHWRRLRVPPVLDWDQALLELPVADLPLLYERWCAAQVAVALLGLPGWSVESQQILDLGDQALRLPDDVALLTLTSAEGIRLRLRYQPRYRPAPDAGPGGRGGETHRAVSPAAPPPRSLDRHTRIPDLAMELLPPDGRLRLIILDAKYRLDAGGGVPEAALADAYSYLGSIGVAGERAVRAVALLYPGRGPAEGYASGVAALPLLPGATHALTDWLAEHVK